jgi:hypothetical protein
MLGEVTRHTGTEIAIIDEIEGLQVSGGNGGDVNDALERLSRIETPLVRKPGFLCRFINNSYSLVLATPIPRILLLVLLNPARDG